MVMLIRASQVSWSGGPAIHRTRLVDPPYAARRRGGGTLDTDLIEYHQLLAEKGDVQAQVQSGFAELFGTELIIAKPYEFHTGEKVAVYTWHGCTVELRGRTAVNYVSKETPMGVYLNVHGALEQQRVAAEQENTRGPVTMVVGPGEVGKSTLTRILLNYAVRMGRKPIFVDLDVGQGHISIPGTIGAMLVERPASIEEGFSQQAPLVYHFGHKSPGENLELYNTTVTRLAEVIAEKCENNKKASKSGVIINTCAWNKGASYEILTHAAQAFEVDVILVLGSERLHAELKRDVPECVKVVYLPKSGGVEKTTSTQRAEARDGRIREYFYGKRIRYYPYSFEVKFSDLKIYKVGAPALPDSCMPLGMRAEDAPTKLVPVWPAPALAHRLLAVSFAAGPDDDVLHTNLAGFVCVTAVDMKRQTLAILSPQPRPLPDAVLLLSEMQYMDD